MCVGFDSFTASRSSKSSGHRNWHQKSRWPSLECRPRVPLSRPGVRCHWKSSRRHRRGGYRRGHPQCRSPKSPYWRNPPYWRHPPYLKSRWLASGWLRRGRRLRRKPCNNFHCTSAAQQDKWARGKTSSRTLVCPAPKRNHNWVELKLK